MHFSILTKNTDASIMIKDSKSDDKEEYAPGG